MNILAKICVVVLVVASLVAAVVFTSLATVHPNWRQQFQQEREAYKRLEAKCRDYMEAADRLKVELADARQALSEEKSALQQQIADLESQKAQLKAENTHLQHNIDEIKDKLADIRGTTETQTKLATSLREKLDECYTRENKIQMELMRVADQLKEAQAETERYERNQKVIKENAEYLKAQLAEKNKIIERLRAGGAREADTVEVAPMPAQKLTGRVTAVTDNLASVNIGSAHGVETGMRLIIYRGDQFVGNLKIEEVGVNDAAGVVLDRRLTPQQGDQVTSSLD